MLRLDKDKYCISAADYEGARGGFVIMLNGFPDDSDNHSHIKCDVEQRYCQKCENELLLKLHLTLISLVVYNNTDFFFFKKKFRLTKDICIVPDSVIRVHKTEEGYNGIHLCGDIKTY